MRLFGLLAWMSLLVVGCSEEVGTLAPTPGSEAPSLDGRVFILQEVTGRDLVEGTDIRLRFQGHLGATAGCNSMGAGYSIEDGRLVIDGGGMSVTEVGCDPERHDQDAWLDDFLLSSPTVALSGDELTLTGDDAVIELLDQEVAEPDRPLVGTTWRVDTIYEGDTAWSVEPPPLWPRPGTGWSWNKARFPEGSLVTLRFSDQETFVATSVDCTSATGDVSIGPSTLTFGDFGVDDVACPRPWAETLDVLGAGETTYEIVTERLLIHTGDVGIGATAG